MADEITVIGSLVYAKSGITNVARSNPTVGGETLDQKDAEIRYVNRVQNIGTSAELLGMADITTPGWCFMSNKGTNAIRIRKGVAGTNLIEIEAGEFALFRIDSAVGTDLAAIADTSATDLEYFILED